MADTTPSTPEPPAHPPAGRGKPGRRRRFVRAALACALGLTLLVIACTRSPVLNWLVLPALGRMTGTKIAVDSMRLRLDATLVARGLRVRAPGIPGPAGEGLSAERVEVATSWGSILRGRPVVERVVLWRPVLRVSRDSESGAINIASISAPARGPDPAPIPSIVVRDGALELGEHQGPSYTPLRETRFDGSVIPTPEPGTDAYALAFAESSGAGPTDRRGLGLTGRIGPDGLSFNLDRLLLSDWGPEHVPAAYREVFALMDIRGAVPRAGLTLAPDGRAELRVELDGVELNLPFDATGRAADPARLVRMRGVTGVITVSDRGAEATLTGSLGDLPYLVSLRYGGAGGDAPFECTLTSTGFELAKNPEILPFAPGIVARRLGSFSNPTGIVDADVTVRRGPPVNGSPAPITLAGEVRLRDGVAAFDGFPYIFKHLDAHATFDEERITIHAVTGRADSGAMLHATGWIAPPVSGAAVQLDIQVKGVPVDEELRRAMGPGRRTIVDALFSAARHEELLARGLVRPTVRVEAEHREREALAASLPGLAGDARERANARLASLDAAALIPAFDFGANADVDIRITREVGEEAEYFTGVLVRMARAGVVPEAFPLPIEARDVALRIENGRADVLRGEFRGIRGGTADVRAGADLTPGDTLVPELAIRASDLPVDELLLHALPGAPGATGVSPADALRALGVRGTIACNADIAPREPGALGYDVTVDLAGLIAEPENTANPLAAPVTLRCVAGTLEASESRMGFELNAEASPRTGPGPTPPATVHVKVSTERDEQGPGSLRAGLEAKGLDVTLAVEDAVGAISPQAAEKIVALRDASRPTGLMDVRVDAAGTMSPTPSLDRVGVEMSNARGVSFDLSEGRVEVTLRRGAVELLPSHGPRLTFRDLEGDVSFAGRPAARVLAAGTMPLEGDWTDADRLDLTIREGRFESALASAAARRTLPASVAELYTSAEPEGAFDADVTVRGGRADGSPNVEGSLRPTSLALRLSGQRVDFGTLTGAFEFTSAGGRIAGLTSSAPGWGASVDGTWTRAGQSAVILETNSALRGDAGLTPELRALLPGALARVLNDLHVQCDGPLDVENLALRLTFDPDIPTPAFRASGRVRFENLAARPGLEVRHASGLLDFTGEGNGTTSLPNLGVGILAREAMLAGVRLRDAAVRVSTDPASGRVFVPAIGADAHGGRLAGSASVTPGPDGGTYEAELLLSGVPLGELLADWERAADAPPASDSLGIETAPPDESAMRRGSVDAGVTLTGTLGEQGARRGRGVITVGGGPVLRLPLLLPLIQISNLQVPSNALLDYAEAAFYLDDDRVVFERIGVLSESVEIFGYGQMLTPSLELDMRFNSRAVRRIPVLNTILESLRNELITTRVTGTPREPLVRAEQFARTRAMLSRAVAREPTPEERRMMEIERVAREAGRRERRIPAPVSPPGGRLP